MASQSLYAKRPACTKKRQETQAGLLSFFNLSVVKPIGSVFGNFGLLACVFGGADNFKERRVTESGNAPFGRSGFVSGCAGCSS
jgi:hypothetical protein